MRLRGFFKNYFFFFFLLLLVLQNINSGTKHQFLIVLTRTFKYFNDVKVVCDADKFKDCFKYMKLVKNHEKPKNACVQQLLPHCVGSLFVN